MKTVAFYLFEMNLRGVANATFNYALYNEKLLKNKSVIIYTKNKFNNNEVINKFKKSFSTIKINKFEDLNELLKNKKVDNFVFQKGGVKHQHHINHKDYSVLAYFPNNLLQIHGKKYCYVSRWLSKSFSNSKIPVVPYIVQLPNTQSNLRKILKIKKSNLVFGYHGGESSFDLPFVHKAIKEIIKKRQDIYFIFLNINKFCNHPRIIFLKGSNNMNYKTKFINSCNAMIYGRSLGESFGLSCGEFAIKNKPIISYKFCRHRNHIFEISKKRYVEYHSRKSLIKIINNFDKKNYFRKNTKNDYAKYNPNYVMKKFNKFLLGKAQNNNLNLLDHCISYYNLLYVNYFYIRHKIYEIYFRFVESKLSK
jgi:hypothetical protein